MTVERDQTALVELDIEPDVVVFAAAMNDAGRVVGSRNRYEDLPYPDYRQAFVFDLQSGAFIDLAPLLPFPREDSDAWDGTLSGLGIQSPFIAAARWMIAGLTS